MNPPRSSRYLLAILALIGLVLGSNLGALADQAAGAALDPQVVAASRACPACLRAGLDFAGDVLRVNTWLLAGALLGAFLGVLVYALLRMARPDTEDPPEAPASPSPARSARFSQALESSPDAPAILEHLRAEALRATQASCGSIVLFDLHSPEQRVARRVGESADLLRLFPSEATSVAAGTTRAVQDFYAEKQSPPHSGVRSALLVPLKQDEEVIGLVHLHGEAAGQFDPERQALVEDLAAQAALALAQLHRAQEQARRNEALRQRADYLQQLARLPAAHADRPLDENLNALAAAAQAVIEFRLLVISLYRAWDRRLAHVVARGELPVALELARQASAPFDRIQPFLREEYHGQGVYVVPHTHGPEVLQALELGRPRPQAAQRAPGQWHPDDLVLVPLTSTAGAPLGLLCVGAPRNLTVPRAQVLELLELAAAQAAQAIESHAARARSEARVEATEARASQASAVAEATRRLAAATSEDEVVALALDELRGVIPHEAATFWRREANGAWHPAGSRSYQAPVETVVARTQGLQPTLFYEIATSRGVLVVSDVTRDVRFEALDEAGLGSWMGVPVLGEDVVLAILALEKSEPGFFTNAQASVALALAGPIASALENARRLQASVARAQSLEQENAQHQQVIAAAQQQLDEQTTISGLSRALSLAVSAEDLAAEVVRQVEAWLRPAWVQLAAYDETRNEVTPLARPASASPEARAPGVPEGALRWVLNTRQPLRTNDLGPRLEALGLPPDATGHRQLLAVPLQSGSVLVGALALADPASSAGFTESHERVLMAVAGQLGFLLDQARLRAEARRALLAAETDQALAAARARLAQLEVVASALAAIAALVHGDDIVAAALDQFQRVLPCDRITLFRSEPGPNPDRRWRQAASRGALPADERAVARTTPEPSVQTLLAEVVAANAPLIVNDTSRDTRLSEAGLGSLSWLIAPLCSGEEALGALVLEHGAPDYFQGDQASVAQVLASQVAAALSNAAQYAASLERAQTLDERNRRLAFVNRFVTNVGAELDVHSTLQVTAQALAQALGAERAAAAAFDESGGEVLAFEHFPPAEAPALLAGPAGMGRLLANQVQALQAPLVVEDVTALEPAAWQRQAAWIGPGIGAALILPLVHAGQVVGVVGLGQSEAGRRFTAQETELAQSVANHAAGAIRNALLFEQTRLEEAASRATAARFAALTEAASAVAAATRLDQAIGISLDQVGHVLPYDRAAFWQQVGADGLWRLAGARPDTAASPSEAPGRPIHLQAPQSDPMAEVCASRTPVAIADTSLDPRFAGSGQPAGSWLGLPLLHQGEVQAMLVLERDAPHAYAPSLMPLARAFAKQTAAALAHVRLYEAGLQRAQELDHRGAVLAHFTADLSEAASLTAALGVIMRAFAQAIGADSAATLVFAEGAGTARVLAMERSAPGEPADQGDFPLGHPAARPLLSAREPVTLDDLALKPDPRRALTAWLGDGIQAALFVPLLARRQHLGLVALGRLRPGRPFAADEVKLAHELAFPAAAALSGLRIAAAAPLPVPANQGQQRPTNRARRWALPVAAATLGVFALGALALAAPPIRQSLGLAASTATPTTVAAPTTVRVNSLAPSVAPTQAPAGTATAQPATTAAPSPTPTRTAAPTASPAPSATVASPTPSLPPGVTALATVRLSEGIAGRLRDGPNGTVIGGVPGNSRVQVLQGRATTDDGLVWVEIIVVDTGARGWIAESLLAYDATPTP